MSSERPTPAHRPDHGPADRPTDFLISYGTADQSWAVWIAWQLEDAGYRVLVQAWDDIAGGNWAVRWQDGVIDAARTIALLSDDYLEALYERPEWRAALATDPLGHASRLIPIKVAECELPPLLRGLTLIDLVNLDESAAAGRLADMLTSLRNRRAKPTSAPPFPSSPRAPRPRSLAPEPPFPPTLANLDNRDHAGMRRPSRSRTPWLHRYWLAGVALLVVAAVSISLFFVFPLGGSQPACVSSGALLVGGDNTFYQAMPRNHRVDRIDAGLRTRIAGVGTETEGEYSGDDGPATAAELDAPVALALAADGSLYISDVAAHVVRKIGRDRKISTVAGTGLPGRSGEGVSARDADLDSPFGIAVDGDALYIADTGNNRVRKVENGLITTVAGRGEPGSSGDDGPAEEARLNTPIGISVGPGGELYIADWGNQKVRMVDADGTITTVAGNGSAGDLGDGGPARSAQLSYPLGVVARRDGTIFVTTSFNKVRSIDKAGNIITVRTRPSGYDAALDGDADSSQPFGISACDDRIYIVDHDRKTIRKIEPSGRATVVDPGY